jgi:type I restriction enzyme M protein
MFADDAGKKGGEFYSPKGVVNLLVKLVKPAPRNTILDPCIGSGGMDLECASYVASYPMVKLEITLTYRYTDRKKILVHGQSAKSI